MTTSIDHFVYINGNSLSIGLCEDIINLYEDEKKKYPGYIASGIDKNIKETTDFLISSGDYNTWGEIDVCLKTEVYKNLEHYLMMMNKEYQNVNVNQKTSADFKFLNHRKLSFDVFQIQRYDKGVGRYVYHDDENFEKGKHRILTYLFYLNNVEEGGETSICNSKFLIKPEAGKLVIFPASWCFPHAGHIPKSGMKYIVTGWIYVDDIKL
jgi:hypothetical protein